MTENSRDMDACFFRVAFLLLLLPNLHELTLPLYWGSVFQKQEGSDAYRFFATIVERIRREPETKVLPFRNLERIFQIQDIEYDGHPRSGLKVVGEFMGLPSLKELHVSNLIAVDDGYTGIPFTWPYSDFDSNLRKVVLEGCCIDSEGIEELVSHTPHLESLTYSHATKWHGCLHDWDAGAFIATIVKKQGHTLKELSVTIHTLFGDVETSPVSLKDCTALEKLELEIELLVAPPHGGEERQNDIVPRDLKWSQDDIPSLSGILPPSVREVILIAGPSRGIADISPVRRLFSKPEDLRNRELFPHLETLVVRAANQRFLLACDKTSKKDAQRQTVRKVLEAAGAVLLEANY